MTEERRGTSQTIVAVATIVSIMIGSIGIITSIQGNEKRITTMEVRLEILAKQIERIYEKTHTPEQKLR